MLVASTLGSLLGLFLRFLSAPTTVSYGSRFVTKKEIVKTISEEIGLTQLKTKEIVQRTFDAIVKTLVEETKRRLEKGSGDGTLGRIELRNFGVFEVKKRAARKARNPRTGERVDVEEKFVVTFKPGKEMEERIRQLSSTPDENSGQDFSGSGNSAMSDTSSANDSAGGRTDYNYGNS